MGAIKVTFGEIANAQQSVSSTSQQINAQLDDLKRSLQPMVSTWEGQAREDYLVKQKQWDTAAADLNQVLQQISVALGHANDGYQQTERTNAGRWA